MATNAELQQRLVRARKEIEKLKKEVKWRDEMLTKYEKKITNLVWEVDNLLK